jgi:hypothetical protein
MPLIKTIDFFREIMITKKEDSWKALLAVVSVKTKTYDQ